MAAVDIGLGMHSGKYLTARFEICLWKIFKDYLAPTPRRTSLTLQESGEVIGTSSKLGFSICQVQHRCDASINHCKKQTNTQIPLN